MKIDKYAWKDQKTLRKLPKVNRKKRNWIDDRWGKYLTRANAEKRINDLKRQGFEAVMLSARKYLNTGSTIEPHYLYEKQKGLYYVKKRRV